MFSPSSFWLYSPWSHIFKFILLKRIHIVCFSPQFLTIPSRVPSCIIYSGIFKPSQRSVSQKCYLNNSTKRESNLDIKLDRKTITQIWSSCRVELKHWKQILQFLLNTNLVVLIFNSYANRSCKGNFVWRTWSTKSKAYLRNLKQHMLNSQLTNYKYLHLNS